MQLQAIMFLCHENIPQARVEMWCSVIQLPSKCPPLSSPWLDLDAACIHHCIA